MVAAVIVLACIVAGAFLYRWRGGGFMWAFGRVHRAIKLAACAAFVTLPVALSGHGLGAAIAFAAAMFAVSRGHGAYMDLSRTQPEKSHDRVGQYQEEPDWAWLFRRLIPSGEIAGRRYWYEAWALSMTGAAVTLAPALLLALAGQWPAAAVMLLAGAAKGPAYMLGWYIPRWPWSARPDEIRSCEAFFGAALGAGVGLALVLI